MHRNISSSLIFIAVLAVTGCIASLVDVDAEMDSLRSRIEEVQAAEAARDLEVAVSFWAKDAILQTAGVPQMNGHEAISTFLRNFFEGGQLKEFSSSTTHLSVSESGDLAYEYGINRTVLAGSESDLLVIDKFLTVWKKVEGQWFIAAVSTTRDTSEPLGDSFQDRYVHIIRPYL